MKKLFLTILTLTILLNVKSGSFVRTLPPIVLFANSGATDACGEAIANSILALNNLSQTNFCALHAILNDSIANDSIKWVNIAANTNLSAFYNTMNTSIATLNSNNFGSMSSSDLNLVQNKVKDILEGTAAAKPECLGYYNRCGQIYEENKVCLSQAFGSFAVHKNWAGLAASLAGCDAALIYKWAQNIANYPGCFSTLVEPPKTYVRPIGVPCN